MVYVVVCAVVVLVGIFCWVLSGWVVQVDPETGLLTTARPTRCTRSTGIGMRA